MRQLPICLLFFVFLGSLSADCSPDYTYNNDLNVCIRFPNVTGTWNQAWVDCRMENGQLFSIHNAFQNSFVANLFAKLSGESKGWLGAKIGLGANGAIGWADETPFDYQRLQQSSGAGNCSILDSNDLMWRMNDCSRQFKYLCYSPTIIPSTTDFSYTQQDTSPNYQPTNTPVNLQCLPPASQPLYKCQQGWQYSLQTGYQYLVATDMFFDDAESYCSQQGAHLVSIHSDEENDFVTNLCCGSACQTSHDGAQYSNYLTGGKQINGAMTWTDGSPFDYQHATCENDRNNGDILFISNFNGCGSCGVSGLWIIDEIPTPTPYIVCKK
ncbi:unnamed protein product, partial [Mesorhabditis belari]|uniref:C-type lectin domain-containing protein n=1 Tax=Mesorhabditis belari TaxID=2138241 RepID=A0AAF3EL87_9BILA